MSKSITDVEVKLKALLLTSLFRGCVMRKSIVAVLSLKVLMSEHPDISWRMIFQNLKENDSLLVQVAVWAGVKFLFAVFQVIGVFKVWLVRKNDLLLRTELGTGMFFVNKQKKMQCFPDRSIFVTIKKRLLILK